MESDAATRPAVLIINGSEDALHLLTQILEAEGFRASGARAWELDHGKVDPQALLRRVKPDVIVYDVSLPYDLAWAYFTHFRSLPEAQGVPVVLTTTNRKGAEALTGPGVLELLLKPYDIGQLLERLRAGLAQRRAAREGAAARARGPEAGR